MSLGRNEQARENLDCQINTAVERREEREKNGSFFRKDLFPRKMRQSGELAKAQTGKKIQSNKNSARTHF